MRQCNLGDVKVTKLDLPCNEIMRATHDSGFSLLESHLCDCLLMLDVFCGAGAVVDLKVFLTGRIAFDSSAFCNNTLLLAAKYLVSALKVADGQYRARISYDLMHLQYVLLIRWEQLRANATAMGIPWPVHDSKQAEFQQFAAACTVCASAFSLD